MSGKVQLFHDRPIHGPYTEEARHDWVRRLLEAQTWIRVNGPDYVAEIELVSMEELHEIRRIWVFEKREIEDALPGIYLEATGEEFPGPSLENVLVLRADDLAVLRDICGGDDLHYEMTRGLLDVERQYRSMARRAGLFDALEKTVRRCYFDDEEDAVDFARRRSLPFEVVAADADVINIDRTA